MLSLNARSIFSYKYQDKTKLFSILINIYTKVGIYFPTNNISQKFLTGEFHLKTFIMLKEIVSRKFNLFDQFIFNFFLYIYIVAVDYKLAI